MSARKIYFTSAVASLAIALVVPTIVSAQAPGPGGYGDPNYAPAAGDPGLRIPRGAVGDLRPAMDNSYANQPNASLPAPANYGAPAAANYGAPAQGAYGAPAQGGYGGAPAGNYGAPIGDPNAPGAYQDPNAVQPYPNKYQKSKHGGGGGPSGVGMVVGGPVKAATTSVGVTGKAVKEVFKAIF